MDGTQMFGHTTSLLFCCYLLLLPTPIRYFINVEIRLV